MPDPSATLKLLLQHDSFVLSTHIRPDGDAIGSEIGLARFLEQMGKTVRIINSDPAPYNLEWLPGIEKVEAFDGSLDQRTAFAEADAIIAMDTNTLDRLGAVGPSIELNDGTKVLIDHHPHPEDWYDHQYARTEVSSTGELVYELIAAQDASLIDEEVATALYAAIMTDTGSFRFSNVNAKVHRAIAELLERGGVSPTPIHEALFDTRSLQGLRLLGLVLESVTLRHGGQLGYVVVSQQMVRESHASLDETEGFVNYVLGIEGVRVALIFTEIEKGTKISFRSKGDAAVNAWARSFGGGGHPNASGAFVEASLDDTVDRVIGAAASFIDFGTHEEPTAQAGGEDLSDEDASYLSALMSRKQDD